jgi:hypothetical protein
MKRVTLLIKAKDRENVDEVIKKNYKGVKEILQVSTEPFQSSIDIFKSSVSFKLNGRRKSKGFYA